MYLNPIVKRVCFTIQVRISSNTNNATGKKREKHFAHRHRNELVAGTGEMLPYHRVKKCAIKHPGPFSPGRKSYH